MYAHRFLCVKSNQELNVVKSNSLLAVEELMSWGVDDDDDDDVGQMKRIMK